MAAAGSCKYLVDSTGGSDGAPSRLRGVRSLHLLVERMELPGLIQALRVFIRQSFNGHEVPRQEKGTVVLYLIRSSPLSCRVRET